MLLDEQASAEQLEILRRMTPEQDRKSTRLNSSHLVISYAVFCLKKKKKQTVSSSIADTSFTPPCIPTRLMAHHDRLTVEETLYDVRCSTILHGCADALAPQCRLR